MYLRVLVLLVFLWPGVALGQQDGLLQINDPIHQFLMRQQTRGLLPTAHLSHQPLSAYEANQYLDSLAVREERLTPADRTLLRRFRGEETHPGATWVNRHVSFLYGNGQDFLSVAGDGYALQLNPMAYLTAGQAWRTRAEGVDPTALTWQNTRAVRASGHISRHIFFESRVEEVQRVPARDTRSQGTAPRERVVRTLPNRPGSGIWDYGRAMGMVGFRNRFFEVRFGRDRNRWTSGINSLFLSDYAPHYDQLQLRTTVWRLQFTNMFAGFDNRADRAAGLTTPRKYATLHHLAVALTDRLQLEAFQGVIFAEDTTQGRRSGFDMAMMNPVIFYHQVEKDWNRQGNFVVGTGASWLPIDGLRTYGQLMLTEFKANELFSSRRWWGNHWAVSFGLHGTDLLLPGLDGRFEFARIRPYIYSHHTGASNYIHFNDYIGHPAGQNLQDFAFFVTYRPTPVTFFELNAAFTRRGRDTSTENYGGDPRTGYHQNRVRDYDVRLLQGIRRDEVLLEARAGYELLPRLFAEATLRMERIEDAELGLNRYLNPMIGLRWGMPFQSVRY